MKKNIVCTLIAAWAAGALAEEAPTLSTIAFGSCCHQNKHQDHWQHIAAMQPGLFILLGDNIYGDTRDMEVLKQKWGQLGAQPGYQSVKAVCPIEAVWDDHDYGQNDAGAEYPMKKESQAIFLDFFEVPPTDPRRSREGTYTAKLHGPENQRVQIIYLDTRYFRGPLLRQKIKREPGTGLSGPYIENPDRSSTLLGDAQWAWLEEQFKVPARIRIIASSIQFVANDHGWEKWGNLPHERQRMIDLINKTQANGVLFISGDRHRGEFSRLVDAVGYPLFDVTSSAMNNGQAEYRNEINVYRYGTLYGPDNFGSITIDWSAADPLIRLQLRSSQTGKVVAQHALGLSAIQPK